MSRQPDHPSANRAAWPGRVLVLGGVLSAILVVERLGRLREHMDRAERERELASADLREHLDGVRSELAGMRVELQTAFEQIEGTDQLSQRLQSAEHHLGSIGQAIEAHSSSLVELEQAQASFGPGLEKELRERDERLLKRWEVLNELVSAVQKTAVESKEHVELLDKALSTPPDLRVMWGELVGPVVQLAGEASVGSGVLLPSQPDPERDGWRTLVITAWHVVRDIQGDPPDLALPVPVQIYAEDGSARCEQAQLLNHDPRLDAALLEIVTPEPFEHGVRMAPRERLAAVCIFDEVVAVGCPLGNDPIPTRGEVATCHHEVDGETYWMINAPTYIGNSGGGIFDSQTHELLGIFSKIYTHGSLRPTIVPHMGLATPLGKIYDWLEQIGHPELVPAASAAVATAAN